jgi:hypothetical protein
MGIGRHFKHSISKPVVGYWFLVVGLGEWILVLRFCFDSEFVVGFDY